MHSLEAIFKIGCLLAAVLLLQCCSGEQKKNIFADLDQQINDRNFTEFHISRIAKSSREILKDPSVIANHNERVEIFRQNLKDILTRYYSIKRKVQHDTQSYSRAFDPVFRQFFEIAQNYIESSGGRPTRDDQFIVDMLKKHGAYDSYMELNAVREVYTKALNEHFAKVMSELEGLFN